MTATTRIEALKAKHADMDSEIDALEKSPGVDDLTLSELKRKKLAVKDEMHRLSVAS